MTEKIKRRGVVTPEHFVPDILEIRTAIGCALPPDHPDIPRIDSTMTVGDLRSWSHGEGRKYSFNTLFIRNHDQALIGTFDRRRLFEPELNAAATLGSLISRKTYSVYSDNSLQIVVEFMLKTGQDVLPVYDRTSRQLSGFISQFNVLKSFEERFRHDTHQTQNISMLAETRRIFKTSRRILRR
jgi:hypothetical protein